MEINKYSRGKIYLIRNKNDDNLIYVGSTIEEYLSKRFCKHKSQNNCSLYMYINNPDNNTTWSDWYIELYENYPCNSKMELVKKENEIIREKATINKIGYLTDEDYKKKYKEYIEKNKEKIKEKDRVYQQRNREHILKKKAEYNEIHREEKNKYMKERYILKKEELLLKEKERRNKNNEKINCGCGSCIVKYKLADHIKTKKHILYIAEGL
jgi:hypothetical protein